MKSSRDLAENFTAERLNVHVYLYRHRFALGYVAAHRRVSHIYKTQFKYGETSLDMIIVASPEMGMPIAAVFAAKLNYVFRSKHLGVAGVCAGVRTKSKIGDVLVADPCVDLGSGKWTVDNEDGELKFLPALYQPRLDDALRTNISLQRDNKLLLENIWKNFHCSKPKDHPEVIVGPMGSGSLVLQHLK